MAGWRHRANGRRFAMRVMVLISVMKKHPRPLHVLKIMHIVVDQVAPSLQLPAEQLHFKEVRKVAEWLVKKGRLVRLANGHYGLIWFFMTGYVPVGFEFAADITYPEPEGTSAGILNGSMQVFGILLTMMASKLLNEFGDLWSNLGLAMSLLVGLVLTGLIKPNLKRPAAQVLTCAANDNQTIRHINSNEL